MIRAVVFDFFDVIRDDGSTRWRKKYGIPLEGDFLRATQRHDRGETTDKEFFSEIGKLVGQNGETVEYELEHGNELNRELIDYISGLGKCYKIALLSNANSNYIRAEIANFQIEKYFDEIVISSEVGYIKPEKEIFALVAKRLGVKASECVFIDDNPGHITGAEAAGIKGILFESNHQLKRDLDKLLQ